MKPVQAAADQSALLAVIVTSVRPTGADKKATTTWFDMFRIENGRIAEH
ncbi:hypothetical protein [Scleromatobacter humisilvae]|uniref:SnoaL-like domain-containing protein n=1 Tax=Scleromatobacter humisilvae TaxID=2897159 RepID=A0A9X1YIJ2_9BURK|nr:hypothetical protein [Scleromatobacter humisilvae]MCK9685027.1 hypothetical protein [Scleromatobacter humisilvae]